MADVHIKGPNIQGSYNVFVFRGSGVAGMSLSLTEIAELHKQLGALLNGKVKDQPRVGA